MRSFIKHIFLFFITLTVLSSCDVTRRVPQGRNMLNQVVIDIKKDKSIPRRDRVKKSELEPFIQQDSIHKFLGTNIRIHIYNMANPEKNGWGNRFLRSVGTPPVILDSASIVQSEKYLRIYLQSIGNFEASVTSDVQIKKRKAKVTYSIDQGQPCYIDSVRWEFRDDYLEPIVSENLKRSLLRKGQVFNRGKLEDERQRITRILNNKGFQAFTEDNIEYIVDTSMSDRKFRVTAVVKQHEDIDENGKKTYENNKLYTIRNIYVQPEYNAFSNANESSIVFDTVAYRSVNFLYKGDHNIRPEILVNSIGIFHNDIYNLRSITRARDNIISLDYYRNAQITFTPVKDSLFPDDIIRYPDKDVYTKQSYLDCNIFCSPAMKQGYKLEGEATTTSSYYGMSVSLGYQNRNLFKGAEYMEFGLKTGYEFIKAKNKTNSFEIGGSASLLIPRFLIPFNMRDKHKLSDVKTRIELSINNQNRPDYRRTVSAMAFGYAWNVGNSSYVFKPLDVSIVSLPWVSQDFLDNITNPYLKNSYKSQLIVGMITSYYYNKAIGGSAFNEKANLDRYSLRVNFDVNGNLLRMISGAFSNKVNGNGETYYTIFGQRYAQYIRGDVNTSYRFAIGSSSSLVYRLYAGYGHAYGNSSSMPFERLFFSGGSNSMRGWQVRDLGPGESPKKESHNGFPNQLGNIKFEANMEYRFPISGVFNGAWFIDAGNIWLSPKKGTPDDEVFKINKFYRQLGLNTGVGMRIDIGFFVLRVDWGMQLHNPNNPVSERWVNGLKFKNGAVHFGIGYPF